MSNAFAPTLVARDVSCAVSVFIVTSAKTFFLVENVIVACEQALHLGDIVKSTRARGTREETRLRGAGKRKGELATISRKISFPPRKPRDIVKRENCHHRHAAN